MMGWRPPEDVDAAAKVPAVELSGPYHKIRLPHLALRGRHFPVIAHTRQPLLAGKVLHCPAAVYRIAKHQHLLRTAAVSTQGLTGRISRGPCRCGSQGTTVEGIKSIQAIKPITHPPCGGD
ncbi:hypothetical protein Vretimale_1121 [Volvox reticuliferus]|uniref:Uncharacterized protein n=1 Tax=Volvox reticuliferus TaxID=1737510 RepID=A0A8J4D716_9CHLO|nr:hypothetical protein Vretifemale_10392 [Volvox reticuliferus]GIL95006.1 hypothetical protein Vretimale_1121 [Volvox reticuliferus]